jgi:hypothetical protein
MSKFSEMVLQKRKLSLKETLVATLDEESYRDFIHELQEGTTPIPVLVDILREFGVATSEASLQRWRKHFRSQSNAPPTA